MAGMVELAWVFLKIGVIFFGGGYVLIPLLHRLMVDHYHWLTLREFLDGVALSQLTPGPLAMLATFAGFRAGGFWGGFFSVQLVPDHGLQPVRRQSGEMQETAEAFSLQQRRAAENGAKRAGSAALLSRRLCAELARPLFHRYAPRNRSPRRRSHARIHPALDRRASVDLARR
jgi:hypothetical protein